MKELIDKLLEIQDALTKERMKEELDRSKTQHDNDQKWLKEFQDRDNRQLEQLVAQVDKINDLSKRLGDVESKLNELSESVHFLLRELADKNDEIRHYKSQIQLLPVRGPTRDKQGGNHE